MSPYVGKSYSDEEILEWMKKRKIKKKHKVIESVTYHKIAQRLADGMIIGRITGAMSLEPGH